MERKKEGAKTEFSPEGGNEALRVSSDDEQKQLDELHIALVGETEE